MNDGMESLGVDYVKASAPQRHVSTPTFDLQLKQRLGKASDGLGAVVWDCGLALANFLSRNPEIVRGKRVIDLGCGTGIAGIAAAASRIQWVAPRAYRQARYRWDIAPNVPAPRFTPSPRGRPRGSTARPLLFE